MVVQGNNPSLCSGRVEQTRAIATHSAVVNLSISESRLLQLSRFASRFEDGAEIRSVHYSLILLVPSSLQWSLSDHRAVADAFSSHPFVAKRTTHSDRRLACLRVLQPGRKTKETMGNKGPDNTRRPLRSRQGAGTGINLGQRQRWSYDAIGDDRTHSGHQIQQYC